MKPRLSLGGAPESDIAALEHDLAVHFPAEYRAFLAEHGAAVLGSTEIYGLGTSEPGPPNLRWLLGRLPDRGFVRPDGIVPIAEVGNGDLVALVCAAIGDHPRGSIVYWSPPDRLELAAASFHAWLQDAG